MSLFTTLISSKVAVGVLGAGIVTAGATGAAAYANVLPAPLQQSAHALIGAPAPETATTTAEKISASQEPSPTASSSAIAQGPDATGPAAYGLCNAYLHGGLKVSSTAYTSLVTAAKGSANIVSYCASVPTPGKSAVHRSAAPSTSPQSGALATHRENATVAATSPQLHSQSAPGVSHKPATAGKP